MKIGELAQLTGTPVETIRYYERSGLLPAPARSGGNYRVYAEGHAARLSFIRHCRALDMSLDEVRVLLRFTDAPGADCTEVNALLDEHIGHVSRRVRELRALERELKALRRQCAVARDAGHCGILQGLAAGQAALRRAPSHIGSSHAGSVHEPPARAGVSRRPGP